ncbi:S-adenosyl-L-methionine-dependent methyltransferase [Pseudohyphozyma bogoriensis]|nr:S-adenosyl-L-methionine-dependent methyltransferase [Pseudohyphozyma bogoriensis]
MTSTTGKSELKALLALLNSSVTALLDSDDEIPSLHDPVPTPPAIKEQTMVAIGAATQLKALLEGPMLVVGAALQFHLPSCLRVAIEAHVVETIRESGKAEGLHVTEIAKSSAIDPAKLERILRLLAAHHIFIETSEGVFANNRCSVGLDTGRSVAQLKASPFYYQDTNGLAALITHTVDDIMKASGYVADALLDPKTSHSFSPAQCAYQLGHQTQLPAWEHFALPENETRLARFGMAMRAVDKMAGPNSSLLPHGFDFKALKEDAAVIDVGGGTGSLSLLLTQQAPHIKITLQDRPEVVNGECKTVWEKENPQAISLGRVKLTAHDFFKPQPIAGADVYMLRAIIHDWPDKEATTILTHLAAAASPSSKLVLLEHIMTPLFWPDGKAPKELYSLLPSLGSVLPYNLDLQMMTALNAQERTLDQYKALAMASGWKLENVYREGKGGWDQMVFVKSD